MAGAGAGAAATGRAGEREEKGKSSRIKEKGNVGGGGGGGGEEGKVDMKAFSGLPTLAASLGHNTHWLSHAPLEIILGALVDTVK